MGTSNSNILGPHTKHNTRYIHNTIVLSTIHSKYYIIVLSTKHSKYYIIVPSTKHNKVLNKVFSKEILIYQVHYIAPSTIRYKVPNAVFTTNIQFTWLPQACIAILIHMIPSISILEYILRNLQ